MRRERGITLIALVITIMVLIILAGISIQLLLGENGIITKAKKGKGDYEESAVREKVEIALVDYNSDKITKGEEGEVEEALNKLLDNNTFDDIEIEENIGIIDDYEITLGKEKGEVIIDGIDKIIGMLRLRCKLNTRDYTNREVTITVKATGNVIKVIKPDGTEVEANNGQVEFNYPVSTNGNYIFKTTDIEGNSIEKTVIVNNIDTLEPKDFSIEAKAITGSGFTIIGQAEDEEATETSACSGISRQEYFVKTTDENDSDEPYKTNEITNLTQGTYQVYAVAYDKAGNSKQSETIEVKITIKIAKVATGYMDAFMIDEEGNLYAVGYNTGQLGDGTTDNRTTPVKIKEGTKFKEVVVGAYRYVLAIDIEGNLWGWGYNKEGQLGDGTTTDRLSPIQIREGTKFKEVAAGGRSSCAIDEEGNLWAWGANNYGQLGDGTTNNRTTPVKIKEGTKFKKVAMGYNTSYAIDEEGNLWACGLSRLLGEGTTITTTATKTLKRIKPETKFKEIKVSSTDENKYAIDEEGNLWGWGYNKEGQLGDGTTNNRTTPIQIKEGTKFKKIAMCINSDVNVGHSLSIDEEGNLWASGRNNYDGVLGNNSTVTSLIQVQIKEGTKFKEVAASRFNSYAIDEEGNLWAWGNNGYGQLVNGTTTGSKVPIQAF